MLFETQGVQRTYLRGGSEVRALDDVSVQIDTGEFVAITGPSGCGKTTLMHILGLIDPGYRGKVRFGDSAVEQLGHKTRAGLRLSKIGFVFQHFNLLPALSALDNVALPHWHLNRNRHKAREKARELLTAMDLADRIHHGPSRLSGGEMQRVALARALVNDPEAVLADEPSAHLDADSTKLIIQMFQKIQAKGTTIVVASHDPFIVEQAQRSIQLYYGRLAGNA